MVHHEGDIETPNASTRRSGRVCHAAGDFVVAGRHAGQ
jgi:hypothetical protein